MTITHEIKKDGCPDCGRDAVLTFYKTEYTVSLMKERCAEGCGFEWERVDNDPMKGRQCDHYQCHNEVVDGTSSCTAHTFCNCPKVDGKYHAHYMPECPN